MIGLGSSISHLTDILNYVLEESKGHLIDKNFLINESPSGIASEFRMFQKQTRATNSTFSFVLSPAKTEGKQITDEIFKDIGNDFLKSYGLDEHQSIIVRHTEKDHDHLHIIANRCNLNGKARKDWKIWKDSQKIADELAIKYGLTRSMEVFKNNKEEIKQVISKVINEQPKNFSEYILSMQENGINVIPTLNKKGNMIGYNIEYKGKKYKISCVERKATLSKLTPLFQSNLLASKNKIKSIKFKRNM